MSQVAEVFSQKSFIFRVLDYMYTICLSYVILENCFLTVVAIVTKTVLFITFVDLTHITVSTLSNGVVLVRHETAVDIISCNYRHVHVHGILDPCLSVKWFSRVVRLYGQVARTIS